MSILQTGRNISKTIKNAARLKVITSTFLSYGFQNIAERIPFENFPIGIGPKKDIEKFNTYERMRMVLEVLGPVFIKLGQLLASRPDLIPSEYAEEFKKLQHDVLPVDVKLIHEVILKELGKPYHEIFLNFEDKPIGSASIGQVHKAQLLTGEQVVVKVQRPGIIDLIEEDLSVLYLLAGLVDRYIPEAKSYNLTGIIEEFHRTLVQETNYFVEANNIRRFTENFINESNVVIPKVYLHVSTSKVLVLECLNGLPLANKDALNQPNILREEIIRTGLKTYFKMIFSDRLFHGDIHPGNFFVLPDNKIGLIDFGIVGQLSKRLQTSIASMLVALANEDYERLAFEYVDLAPFRDTVDVNKFANDLRNAISPFFGLTLKEFNPGLVLMETAALAGKQRLVLPSELILFFRSIIAIEAMGKTIKKDFDFLSYSQEFAVDLMKDRLNPQRMLHDFSDLMKDSMGLIVDLPRQLKFLLRRYTQPNYAIKLDIQALDVFRNTLEKSIKLLFLGMIIGSLILSASIIFSTGVGPKFFNMPLFSLIGYGIAGAMSFIAFINYIKKNK